MKGLFYVFTDEAGSYKQFPGNKFRKSHPFYIRSNVRISLDDYRVYQKEIHELNEKYGIPIGEEIKWSDLWKCSKGGCRKSFLEKLTIKQMQDYIWRVFYRAQNKSSLEYIYTITLNYNCLCNNLEETILNYHMQEVFQRVQMDIRPDGFATVVIDELNEEKMKKLKSACHTMMVNGDFVQYNNLYHGVLTEGSSYSAGIQLADYSAGIMNGYLRASVQNKGSYEYATKLYHEYIHSNLRRHVNGTVMGYGVREVPSSNANRLLLQPFFDEL